MIETGTKFDIHRSGLAVTSYQLAGLCEAFTLLKDSNEIPGDPSMALLKTIEGHVRQIIAPKTFEGWPEFPTTNSMADLLVRTFALRATVAAFLSPDEAAEQTTRFGFQPRSQS